MGEKGVHRQDTFQFQPLRDQSLQPNSPSGNSPNGKRLLRGISGHASYTFLNFWMCLNGLALLSMCLGVLIVIFIFWGPILLGKLYWPIIIYFFWSPKQIQVWIMLLG